MPICGTKSQMPGHRRSKRSSSVVSPARCAASRSTAMRISTTETEKVSHRRRSRSPGPSSSGHAKSTHPVHPACVLLNRVGARRDQFHGDITTSSISHISIGDQISVSFELVEPPQTSLLVLHWPHGPDAMDSTLSYPHVLSSHGNAVLFEVSSRAKHLSAPVDYFVYGASSQPSIQSILLRLPPCYWKGSLSVDPPRPRILSRRATGILSLAEHLDSFQVIELEGVAKSPSNMNVYIFWSESNEWKVFRDIHVHGSRGGSNLCWWSTDVVIPRGGNQLIWVDYYRGMIVGSMRGFANEPHLQYIQFPIKPVRGNPEDPDYGRGCPEASRSLCVMQTELIKFISINQHSNGFDITMWRWIATHNTWTQEITIDASQFWELDRENSLPHVCPEFPVIDIREGNIVYFLLKKDPYSSATTSTIKVDMKHGRLLGVKHYSGEGSLSQQDAFLTARKMSMAHPLIFSDMPNYLRKLTKPEVTESQRLKGWNS